MSGEDNWLPDLVRFDSNAGDWDEYLAAVHGHFQRDFVLEPPTDYMGKRFALKRHPLRNGKEATFWHLITEGADEQQRSLDIRRCERIRWPRAMLETPDGRVCRWKNRRGTGLRIVTALLDFSYAVVLDERTDFVLLWTAYVVEHQHQRQKMRREYEAYRKG